MWKNCVFCLSAIFIKVLRCREFPRTYDKTRFSHACLIFIRHFESFLALLFYSKRKVWIIFEQMSTVGAPYDKNSLLWLLQSFDEKRNFIEKSIFFEKNWIFAQKSVIHQNSARATEASFCRMELLRYSFDQKLSILCA